MTKDLIRFRKSLSSFKSGRVQFLESNKDTIVMLRGEGEQEIVCIFNLSSTQQHIDVHGFTEVRAFRSENYQGQVRLQAWAYWFGVKLFASCKL